MESSKKEKDKISIPIIFNDSSKSSKELFIGKASLKNNKSSYKFKESNSSSQPVGTKFPIKEFTLINKEESKKNIQYKGREAPQDSRYILMKYNQDKKSMQICPANKWVHFIQSYFNLDKNKDEDKEKKKKIDSKEMMQNFKDIFNFSHYEDIKKEKKKKKKGGKGEYDYDKKNSNKNGDNEGDDIKEKEIDYNYKEDSHSSEDALDLDEDSYEIENERRKKEEKLLKEEEKRKKEEEESKKKKENESEEDEDDDSFKDLDSEVDENAIEKTVGFIAKKRNREIRPEEKMEEELSNILRKKGKMSYDEICSELIKAFSRELVEANIDELLDKNTKKYIENKETFYFLK